MTAHRVTPELRHSPACSYRPGRSAECDCAPDLLPYCATCDRWLPFGATACPNDPGENPEVPPTEAGR